MELLGFVFAILNSVIFVLFVSVVGDIVPDNVFIFTLKSAPLINVAFGSITYSTTLLLFPAASL